MLITLYFLFSLPLHKILYLTPVHRRSQCCWDTISTRCWWQRGRNEMELFIVLCLFVGINSFVETYKHVIYFANKKYCVCYREIKDQKWQWKYFKWRFFYPWRIRRRSKAIPPVMWMTVIFFDNFGCLCLLNLPLKSKMFFLKLVYTLTKNSFRKRVW